MPQGQITEHFAWWEARCPCGECDGWGDEHTQAEIVKTAHWAEKIRPLIIGGKQMHINSWYRCKKHNAAVGGEPNSQHLLGKAIDFVVREASPATIQRILAKCRDLVIGLGKYTGFTHADRRDGPPATWRG